MRGCFVTGTDTGVGKTVLAAAIVAALAARGLAVRALKPVITGLDEDAEPDWPADDALLASITGAAREEVSPIRYGPATSPHLAAQLTGRPLDAAEVTRLIREAAAGDRPVVIEGVGGLLVPLAERYDVRAMALDAGLPVLIAARPGLGTISHSLMTLKLARAAGLEVAGVVLTPWPEQPDAIERSNRETIAELGDVEVATLPRLPRADQAALAAAGERLPLTRWL